MYICMRCDGATRFALARYGTFTTTFGTTPTAGAGLIGARWA